MIWAKAITAAMGRATIPIPAMANTGQTGKCCGLFCVSAISPTVNEFAWRHPPAVHLAPLFVASLTGQDSDRIDRPPRFLLSL